MHIIKECMAMYTRECTPMNVQCNRIIIGVGDTYCSTARLWSTGIFLWRGLILSV